MANTNINNPNGFTPVGYTDGRKYRGECNLYWKDGSVILGIGDPVIRVASSSDTVGYPEVTRATTGAAITGVIVGFQPNRSDLSKTGYMAAADTGYVLVADSPDLEFECMEAGSGTALAITDIGKHIDSITAANASSTRQRSVYAIDNNAKATDNTWILRRLADYPGNGVGAYARWIVAPNLHTEANASATDRTET